MFDKLTKAAPKTAQSENVPLGWKFGKYVVEDAGRGKGGKLGQGGMGIVYLARDPPPEGLDIPRAVKVLKEGLSEKDSFVLRFRTEARKLARMDNNHIVKVYDSGQDEAGRYYLVLEYVDGGSLLEKLNTAPEKRLPPKEVLRILEQVLEGLVYAHDECKKLHQDIKPGNILMTAKGAVKLADFGLAQIMGEDVMRSTMFEPPKEPSSEPPSEPPAPGMTTLEKKKTRVADGSSSTTAGSSHGYTFFYAPDEVIDGNHFSERSDLFSVGVMAYQMLTGKIPRGRYKPISKLVPGVPKAWEAWTDRLLQEDPKDRYPSAKQALEAIPGRKKSRWLAWGAAAAVLALVGTLAWYIFQPVQPTNYGNVFITSEPPGADVYLEGNSTALGKTALSLSSVKPGAVKYTLSLGDYENGTVTGKIEAGKTFAPDLVALKHKQGSVTITSTPSKATVYLADNNTPLGPTPWSGNVNTGNETFVLAADGYENTTVSTAIVEGKNPALNHVLPHSTGSVSISSAPSGATIWSGTTNLGTTPKTLPDIPTGPVSYNLVKSGFANITANGTVRRNDTLELDKTLNALNKNGTVALISAQENVAVYDDKGAYVGSAGKTGAPDTLPNIPEGPVKFTFSLPDYENVTANGTVVVGQTLTLSANLTHLTDTLMVNSDPVGANISDATGKVVGNTSTGPLALNVLTGNNYSYTLKLPQYQDYPLQGGIPSRAAGTPGATYNVTARLTHLKGNVIITSTPPGANVTIGNVHVATTPWDTTDTTNFTSNSGPINTGQNITFTVSKNGYESASVNGNVDDKTTLTRNIALVQSTGTVRFSSQPAGADVYELGNETSLGQTGKTPMERNIPTGQHYYTFKLANYEDPDAPHTVTIVAHGNSTVTATLRPSTIPEPVKNYHWRETLAGAPESGFANGTGIDARFRNPISLAVDKDGNVYVADNGSLTIRKITATGMVTTLAGQDQQSGATDGRGGSARFSAPKAIAVDNENNVYVADDNSVRRIDPAGNVSTLPGPTGGYATVDSIAVDGQGNVYLADRGNYVIWKITKSSGKIDVFAGTKNQDGYATGSKGTARFENPQGLAVDVEGNVYVGDRWYIRKITSNGDVLPDLVAGLSLLKGQGHDDGPAAYATFGTTLGLAVDKDGNIYVADTDNYSIRKISNETVKTIGGVYNSRGYSEGVGPDAHFSSPSSIAVDASGNVYVADRTNHVIRKGTPP